MDAKYIYRIPNNHQDLEKMTFQAWHIGGALSYRMGFFVPYAGVVYSKYNFRLKKKSLKKTCSLSNENPFSISLGFSCAAPRNFLLNIEARTLGEKALSGSLVLRF
jgi:hypothetical protein